MSSKHSIMLSTDADGDASTGKFITPSAHVLAASASKGSISGGTGTQHSSSAASAGDRFITPSVAKSAAPAASSSSSSLSFGDEDVSSSSLLPSSLDSVSSRLPFNPSAPRALAPSITSEMAASMSTLSAAFASMMAGGDKGEQESKQLEGAISSLQGSSATNVAAGAEPSKLSTCFDLITSTATRIPLSTIIAASSSHPSKSAATAGSGSAPALAFALDSYVVVEPIDWSRHHHDSTFARLTAVNRGADQVDEIALELAREREQLQDQLAAREETIVKQRKQIEALQRQLREALAGGAASMTPSAATAAPASAAAASSSASSAAAATVAPKRFPNDTSDDESDDDSIDQGMADEEDFRGGGKPSSNAAASSSSSSASTATFSG